jgi:Fe-S-cluster containining protein
VDEYNEVVFDHPLVKQLSPCKQGCTACCHTQVSVTEDEAYLLATRVKAGTSIDLDRLKIQMQARDSSELFFNLSYEQRKCVFLSEEGSCQVYDDRPSVCRTNAVLGDASQCDTREEQKQLVLVLTENADVTIYGHFQQSKNNGSLPHLLAQQLKLIKS